MSLRTRFTARAIRESLTNRATKLICAVFLSLLFASGIIVFIIWLAVRPHRPRFHVSSFSSATLAFSLSIRNPNQQIGIYYYSMDGSVFISNRLVGSTQLLAEPVYQPPKNTTMVYGQVAAGEGGVGGGSDQGGVPIGPVRIDVRSRFRFRLSTWDTHPHVLHVSCDVEVGPNGEMLPEVQQRRCAIYFT